jgi:hypothetical protein
MNVAIKALDEKFTSGNSIDVERATITRDEYFELRRLHKVNAELLEALKEICDCPQFIDESTVPKAGIETAPQQIIVNMSVALVRLRKAQAAIAKAEESK